MNATAPAPPRFVRRTQLGAHEYRKNFHQIDADVIRAVTSAEADRVTPLMSKIYLRMTSAPSEFWERDGVLYFCARDIEGRQVKASKVLYELLGVASATAHKALAWMHEQGVIGYFAGKNGVGIRIFLNRAAGSIGLRSTAAGKKILPFAQGSNNIGIGSRVEPAFNDSFAVSEVLDKDLDPHAPKNGAGNSVALEKQSEPQTAPIRPHPRDTALTERHTQLSTSQVGVPVEEVVMRLKSELEPWLHTATKRAAAQEHERTRIWLESKGLPKAARVAQREAFNVLRSYGVIKQGGGNSSEYVETSRSEPAPTGPCALSSAEIGELAEACIAMLHVQGQPIKHTLSEMSLESKGFLSPDDAAKVLEKAEYLLASDGDKSSNSRPDKNSKLDDTNGQSSYMPPVPHQQ